MLSMMIVRAMLTHGLIDLLFHAGDRPRHGEL